MFKDFGYFQNFRNFELEINDLDRNQVFYP